MTAEPEGCLVYVHVSVYVYGVTIYPLIPLLSWLRDSFPGVTASWFMLLDPARSPTPVRPPYVLEHAPDGGGGPGGIAPPTGVPNCCAHCLLLFSVGWLDCPCVADAVDDCRKPISEVDLNDPVFSSSCSGLTTDAIGASRFATSGCSVQTLVVPYTRFISCVKHEVGGYIAV